MSAMSGRATMPGSSGDELAPLRVGRVIEQHIGIVARQLGKARAPPHRLEEGLALLVGVVECGALVGRVEESGHRGVEHLPHRLEPSPELCLLFAA